MKRTLMWLLLAAFACESFADAPAKIVFPSDGKIAGEMEKIEKQRREMFEREEVKHPPHAKAPDVPTPVLMQQRVDVLEMAKQFEQKQQAKKPAKPQELIVFASFSMPEASLKKLAQQTERAGGVMILRGFKDGTMKATVQAIQELGLSGTSVQINPPAFSKYRVNVVPTVVLTKPEAATQIDGDGCAMADTYASVSGDVSLGFALEAIGRHDKEFSFMAEQYVSKLSVAD